MFNVMISNKLNQITVNDGNKEFNVNPTTAAADLGGDWVSGKGLTLESAILDAMARRGDFTEEESDASKLNTELKKKIDVEDGAVFVLLQIKNWESSHMLNPFLISYLK